MRGPLKDPGPHGLEVVAFTEFVPLLEDPKVLPNLRTFDCLEKPLDYKREHEAYLRRLEICRKRNLKVAHFYPEHLQDGKKVKFKLPKSKKPTPTAA